VTDAPPLLWDDAPGATVTVLLAAGAGADCRSEFLQRTAAALAQASLRVARFDFPYMQQRTAGPRRGPDPTPVLLACMRAAAAATGVPPARLVLAGKSMGGRMATMLADELQVAGVVVFGYPFHPPRQPERLRTAHLLGMRTPCLILQGERDPFGTAAEIGGYGLAKAIEVDVFTDGDHSLVPRKASGHTAAGHFARAMARTIAFARAVTDGNAAGGALA
jgi:predicted alpha/beta-hydrolase family hydrolase